MKQRSDDLTTRPNALPFESLRVRILAGLCLGVLLVGGVGGWAATARLSGAVIAPGSVKVDQNLKLIQHRDGGIVAEIDVREGDVVARGQVLFRLEDAQAKAELSILTVQLREAEARRARLLADRDGLAVIAFPDHLSADDPIAAVVVAGETRLHAGNLANRESQRRQLELSVEQIGEEIEGLKAQRLAMEDEIALVEETHAKLVDLATKNIVESTRVNLSDRERIKLRGSLGELDASIARARVRIGEVKVRILAIDEVARTDAQRELGLAEARVSELTDRLAAVRDRLERTQIRSPIAGTVNELSVFTVGGVITPAEVLATIVPADANLRIEVRLPPTTIDQVYLGQPARVRFTAFNHRTTPELAGTVAQVAPATTRDEATGEPFYVGYVELTRQELEKLGGLNLMPGMPAEIYIATQEQTAFAYLSKPLVDQFQRTFREE